MIVQLLRRLKVWRTAGASEIKTRLGNIVGKTVSENKAKSQWHMSVIPAILILLNGWRLEVSLCYRPISESQERSGVP